MIRSLFINKTALEKGAVRPKVEDQSVKKVGILGAGMMGAGIAYVSAMAGIEVVLLDRDQAAADKGKAHVKVFWQAGSSVKRPLKKRRQSFWAACWPRPNTKTSRIAI